MSCITIAYYISLDTFKVTLVIFILNFVKRFFFLREKSIQKKKKKIKYFPKTTSVDSKRASTTIFVDVMNDRIKSSLLFLTRGLSSISNDEKFNLSVVKEEEKKEKKKKKTPCG